MTKDDEKRVREIAKREAFKAILWFISPIASIIIYKWLNGEL